MTSRSVQTSHRWLDWLVLIVAVAVAGLSFFVLASAGIFQRSLVDDPKLSWHLVRATGLTSYALLAVSTLWGIFLASCLVKDWTPGPAALLLHATTSWLAVGLTIVHAALLLFDKYYAYKLTDLIIPFLGPYRPFEVGIGILAAWLILTVTVSFSMRKRIGQRAWRLLHYTSYGSFGLVTLHAWLAGTDSSKHGMQWLLGGSILIGVILTGYRLGQSRATSDKPTPARRAVNSPPDA